MNNNQTLNEGTASLLAYFVSKEFLMTVGSAGALASVITFLKGSSANVQKRFRKVAKMLVTMQKQFGGEATGLDMKTVLPKTGILTSKIFKASDNDKGAIGIVPFVNRYIKEIAKDRQYLTGKTSNDSKDNVDVNGNTLDFDTAFNKATTDQAKAEVCYAMISSFCNKYFNMDVVKSRLSSKSTTNDRKAKDQYLVDTFEHIIKSMNNAQSQKDDHTISPFYSRVYKNYMNMVERYIELCTTIVNNFKKYTKIDNEAKDKEQEKQANELAAAVAKFEEELAKQKDGYEANFYRVINTIISSEEYTNTIDAMINEVIPKYKELIEHGASFGSDSSDSTNQDKEYKEDDKDKKSTEQPDKSKNNIIDALRGEDADLYGNSEDFVFVLNNAESASEEPKFKEDQNINEDDNALLERKNKNKKSQARQVRRMVSKAVDKKLNQINNKTQTDSSNADSVNTNNDNAEQEQSNVVKEQPELAQAQTKLILIRNGKAFLAKVNSPKNEVEKKLDDETSYEKASEEKKQEFVDKINPEIFNELTSNIIDADKIIKPTENSQQPTGQEGAQNKEKKDQTAGSDNQETTQSDEQRKGFLSKLKEKLQMWIEKANAYLTKFFNDFFGDKAKDKELEVEINDNKITNIKISSDDESNNDEYVFATSQYSKLQKPGEPVEVKAEEIEEIKKDVKEPSDANADNNLPIVYSKNSDNTTTALTPITTSLGKEGETIKTIKLTPIGENNEVIIYLWAKTPDNTEDWWIISYFKKTETYYLNGKFKDVTHASNIKIATGENKQLSAGNTPTNDSYNIEYSKQFNLAESFMGTLSYLKVTRNITIDSKDNYYVLSENAWGDGSLRNPVEYLKNKLDESSKFHSYTDFANYAKSSVSINFIPVSESSYKTSLPYNRYQMLTESNPLYESLVFVSFDNSDERKVKNIIKVQDIQKIVG